MSKLKSTWDAVNELRGDLTGATYVNTHKENYKTIDVYLHVVLTNDYDSQPIGSFVIYSANKSARGDVRFICTIEEFNNLVAEMELGLDVNPVNHGHYLNYFDADKTLLKKEFEVDYTSKEFWKDATEDANYYWEPSKSFYKFSDCEEDFVFDNDEWVPCSDISRFLGDDLFERPQSTPIETPEEKEALDSIINKSLVYTQEMYDNGELPSVGMMVELIEPIHGNSSPIHVVHRHGNMVWIEIKSGAISRVVKLSHIKPVETRTKKEKAIDELRDLDDSICNDTEWPANFLQAIIDGKITGVKWVGE